MASTSWFVRILSVTLLIAGVAVPTPAQQPGDLEIKAKPVTGQLDVLQGTAIQLGGKPRSSGPKPSSYLWEIIEGQGAIILKPNQPDAIFQAPKLTDTKLEIFLIQLTVTYDGQESATARMQVRVHKEMQTAKRPEPTIEEVMAEQYRSESEARERRGSSGGSRTTVIHHGPSYGMGYGWGMGPGWGWGWPAHYPIYVPIVVPPPGGSQGPGEIDWDEPVAVPYNDVVTNFPEEMANDYLPQDNPMAEPIPDSGFAGSSPADYMVPPDMGGAGMEPMIMDDPGFGGADFAEPMIDPGFGFDDFGW
jgi:hypothetical protein